MSVNHLLERYVKKCSVIDTIELIGGRCKLLILRALLFRKGPMRYGELRREVTHVSQKTLTRNLRELESYGVLTRTIFPEVPPRVEYALTEAGEDLMPVFAAMKRWGKTYLDH